MKKYVYELMFQTQTELEGMNGMPVDYVSQIGFFSSIPEIRKYITEDGSPRDSFKVYRYELNPKHEEQDPVCVEIKWRS